MAASCTGVNEAIIDISDEEERQEEQRVLAYSAGKPVLHITPGMAKVRLDFWQPGVGAPQSGCDGTHALGKHGEQSTGRLGQPAQIQRLPVRVGAPSGHRLEERAQSRVVQLTTGWQRVRQDFYPLHKGVPSTSGSAGETVQEVIDDMLLDYEEEDESD
ncbi:hypothetical protein NDU88_003229 [Pleurodeles waltl]|uniref:Uncharacterized protein n=1 Tax=Pleurodeles waltl TaxID=8319 RepID=A0AAV7Q9F6_PLEWA|nr:hypothetical protein NDU88_003229 [Pleurodeles waltl]